MKKILFSLLLLLGSQCLSAADSDRELTLMLPPDSLGKWYRPANERDVWLHTMFRLRREMQAISEYAALENPGLLKKWLNRLQKDYLSIGDMVPEWADELETGLLKKMFAAAGKGELEKLQSLQGKLGKSCQSCHVEYKLTAALRYRTPDFSSVMVESEETMEEEKYNRVMSRLTLLVNRIKIASDDGRTDTATETLDELQQRLMDLGGSCSSCHKSEAPREGILGKTAQESLMKLKEGLIAKDKKKAGRYMGEFAVGVCAECHSIHRLQSDMRTLLVSDR
jgi:mono/diheme cytochrome c family protein